MSVVHQGLVLFLVTSQVTACYNWVDVRPTELPKLDAGESDGEHGDRVAPGNARLERNDGSLVEVSRSADVRITTKEDLFEFTSPVVARMVKDDLWIRAGNTGKTTFSLGEVEQAEVSKFDGGLTALAIVGTVIGVSVMSGMLVYGLTRDTGSSAASAGE